MGRRVKQAPSRSCMAVIEQLIRAFALSLVGLGLHARGAIAGFSAEDFARALARALASLPSLRTIERT